MDQLDVIIMLGFFAVLLGYGWVSYCQGVMDGRNREETLATRRVLDFLRRYERG